MDAVAGRRQCQVGVLRVLRHSTSNRLSLVQESSVPEYSLVQRKRALLRRAQAHARGSKPTLNFSLLVQCASGKVNHLRRACRWIRLPSIASSNRRAAHLLRDIVRTVTFENRRFRIRRSVRSGRSLTGWLGREVRVRWGAHVLVEIISSPLRFRLPGPPPVPFQRNRGLARTLYWSFERSR